MKTAVIHDWLTTYAGAERVLEQILYLYPALDRATAQAAAERQKLDEQRKQFAAQLTRNGPGRA